MKTDLLQPGEARSSAGNSLTIPYPGSGVKLAWGVPQYAWAQYLDGAGQPLAGQTLIPTGDGSVYIDPGDPKPVTDAYGWAAIKIQVIPPLAYNPPYTAQDATGNLHLQAQTNPGDETQAPITFSTTMGGRGYLGATPATGRTQGYWWAVKVVYRNPDGTPVAHKKLMWENISGTFGTFYPISYSSMPLNPPGDYSSLIAWSYTDQNGECTLYILTQSGYSRPIGIGLRISSTNELNPPADSIQIGPLGVDPRPYAAAVWPNLSGNSGIVRPGAQVALTLNSKKPIPDGTNITWKSLDKRATLAYPSTQMQNGSSVNWATGKDVDTLYNAAVLAESMYPPGVPEQGYFTLTFGYSTPSVDRYIQPNASQPLSSGDWHTFTFNYASGGWATGHAVRWSADPAGSIEFKPPYPGTLNTSGTSSVDLRAVGLTADTRIAIQAGIYNPLWGEYDTAGSTYTFLAQADTGGQIVVGTITPAPVMYAPSTVSATYTVGGKPVSGADIQWAATPPNTAAFSPNLSQTNSQGIASTTMTAYGPNQVTGLTIVASSYDDTTQETVAGSLDVQVAAASTPPSDAAAWLDLVSLEGDTLYGLTWHVLQVSYLYDDGQPVAGKRQIDWSTVDGSGARLQEASTWTDDNGVATNQLLGPGTFQGDRVQAIVRVSTTNPQSSQPDSTTLSLILTANDVEPVSKVMRITVDGPQPISNGYACPINVKYTQADLTTPMVNAPITWAVYPYVEDDADPPYALSFGFPNPTYTGDDGVAVNTISYEGTRDLPDATLVASCFNPLTGQTDFATTRISFVYASPLTGIMVSRPWATNPGSGNVLPSVPCQVLTAGMTLDNDEGDGQIRLQTVPAQLNGVQLYTSDGTQIQAVSGAYTVTTRDRSVEVLVGARFPTFFNLQAYYPVDAQQPLCDTDLWLSTLGGKYADGRYPLAIENLDLSTTPPLLTMPDESTWPEPSFTVSLPANGNGQQLDPDAPLAIILNYRVAYTGKVADAQAPNSIDIAYAMLQPTGNTIAYFVGTGIAVTQRGTLVFDARGQAQTDPWTGGISPTLPMPALVPSLQGVTAADIVNGLAVRIQPGSTQSGWKYQAGDRITVYFYLSGTYPLPDTEGCPSIAQPARNVATLRHTLQAGDDLTTGQAQLLGPIPQALLAGYGAPGTLRMNFAVQRGETAYWSQASATIAIDTATIVPPSSSLS
ncbi:hypothetical protein CAL12_05320 [Bordetella genomosp. 8]|uniref:Big-1 domain-containing protein n=1 Tax=Bordetella genomosp. 8 TaxID=1416806 RepID=A0A1W6YGW2_9BORD|nr:hypothetical protein [Bordetella genomosp. 8]ARP80307.1 hypothetical protein CAL12_05320 [Bordetella genomosp. 8]